MPRSLCVCLLLLLLLSGDVHAGTTWLSFCKWCPEGGGIDVPYYFGEGLNDVICAGGCLDTRLAIWTAMDEYEAYALDSGGLDAAISFTYGGILSDTQLPYYDFGIVFSYENLGNVPCSGPADITGSPILCFDPNDSEPLGIAYPLLEVEQDWEMDACRMFCVVINRGVDWSGYDRLSAVRHEIGHALGLGHSSDRTGDLMGETLACGVTKTLDASAKATLQCIYGDPTPDDCIAEMFEIDLDAYDPDAAEPGELPIRWNTCNCEHSCGEATPPAGGVDKRARVYEFAIREGDGPYSVYALVDESELADQSYTHTFGTSYAAAKIRVRAYESDVLVGEGESTYAIAIEGATAVPQGWVGPRALSLGAAPNPFRARTEISFWLPGEQSVRVSIYDPRGRRVALLHEGMLGTGRQSLPWDGRDAVGMPAAAGVYFARVQTEGAVATRALMLAR